ncbi:ATPase GET3 [Seminavis robusta]|uniref:ATPase ASNA1 homolog n=1 Tax=Seminavis robusta TaxID=568900 RepID=A0A9N8DEI7_9STRA|nr:ATPase GET3 [Seminavis robusta]|eukprot:Sro118_g057890.1 ATPase GET3 (360) ;mRNA; r:100769-102037
MGDEFDDSDLPDPSLKNIIDQKTLQWVFVGGKGGVGKTTTSCCLGAQLAKTRKKVLIVSTDPAHNLSDAFCQKIGREPTPIQGFDNLSAMEIDANQDMDEMQRQMEEEEDQTGGGIGNIMGELSNSIPGIDEAMSFSELMKQVQSLDFDVVVFDTAPTGHTLRLLSFPTILEKALGKVMELKDRFGGLIGQATSALMGGGQNPAQAQDALLGRLEETRAVINKVNDAFQDPTLTTFVCVCIPEFLSIYETERLVQELSKFGINSHNIVVNQVLFPEKDAEELSEWFEGNKDNLPKEAQEICSKMMARKRMQDKYIGQCFDLYGEDFHVILMPLLDYEVRGVEKLKKFSELLIDPVDLEE